jgi:hypothetical protein
MGTPQRMRAAAACTQVRKAEQNRQKRIEEAFNKKEQTTEFEVRTRAAACAACERARSCQHGHGGLTDVLAPCLCC